MGVPAAGTGAPGAIGREAAGVAGRGGRPRAHRRCPPSGPRGRGVVLAGVLPVAVVVQGVVLLGHLLVVAGVVEVVVVLVVVLAGRRGRRVHDGVLGEDVVLVGAALGRPAVAPRLLALAGLGRLGARAPGVAAAGPTAVAGAAPAAAARAPAGAGGTGLAPGAAGAPACGARGLAGRARHGLGGHALDAGGLGRAIGRPPGPFAQPLDVARLREVQGGEHGQAHRRRRGRRTSRSPEESPSRRCEG